MLLELAGRDGLPEYKGIGFRVLVGFEGQDWKEQSGVFVCGVGWGLTSFLDQASLRPSANVWGGVHTYLGFFRVWA